MSMISKQIDDLRAYAKDRKGELAKLVSDAADTIEMLSAKLSAANMIGESKKLEANMDHWEAEVHRLEKMQHKLTEK